MILERNDHPRHFSVLEVFKRSCVERALQGRDLESLTILNDSLRWQVFRYFGLGSSKDLRCNPFSKLFDAGFLFVGLGLDRLTVSLAKGVEGAELALLYKIE